MPLSSAMDDCEFDHGGDGGGGGGLVAAAAAAVAAVDVDDDAAAPCADRGRACDVATAGADTTADDDDEEDDEEEEVDAPNSRAILDQLFCAARRPCSVSALRPEGI